MNIEICHANGMDIEQILSYLLKSNRNVFLSDKALSRTKFLKAKLFNKMVGFIGIKKEDQKRIFERFEQVDASLSRQYQGAGLGLSLSKSFVELHDGVIWVESEGEGQGSTFRFIIPA